MATQELAISGGSLMRDAKDVMLSPIMDLAVAKDKLREFQKFVFEYLVESEDYGKIHGTDKPTLLKPGADKLCDLYGFADTYKFLSQVEDFERNLFHYTFECTLLSKRTGMLVATGVGSCNSYEAKYRYRQAKRKCPGCGKEAIIKGREEYGGGWLCHKKQDGCGTKYDDADPRITSQEVGKVLNDDIPTVINTVLKMAKKRAKVDAVISATRSSGIFTQDIEDMAADQQEHFAKGEREEVIKRKIETLKSDIDAQKAANDGSPAYEEMDVDGQLQCRFVLTGCTWNTKGFHKISWPGGWANSFDKPIGEFLAKLPKGTKVTAVLKYSKDGKYKNIAAILDPLPEPSKQEPLEVTEGDWNPDLYENM